MFILGCYIYLFIYLRCVLSRDHAQKFNCLIWGQVNKCAMQYNFYYLLIIINMTLLLFSLSSVKKQAIVQQQALVRIPTYLPKHKNADTIKSRSLYIDTGSCRKNISACEYFKLLSDHFDLTIIGSCDSEDRYIINVRMEIFAVGSMWNHVAVGGFVVGTLEHCKFSFFLDFQGLPSR